MAACHADYPTFVPNLGEKGKAVLIKVVLLGCCGYAQAQRAATTRVLTLSLSPLSRHISTNSVGKTKILERLSLDPIDRGINAQMSVAPSFSYYRMTVDVFKTDFPVIFQVVRLFPGTFTVYLNTFLKFQILVTAPPVHQPLNQL